MKLQRAIGSFGLLLAGIGSIIGSGWLFGPLYAAQIAGPAAIVSWVIGGVLMIIIALTFAELGTAFPVSGGMVQYAQYSHGPLISFMTGWMVWISSIAVAPVETMALIQYAGNYVPGLILKVDNTTVLTQFGIFIGAIIMLIMCVLNCQGARFFSKSNNLITAIKLIVPILTAIILISISFHASNFYGSSSGSFAPNGWHGILSVLPLGGVIYSFIGANTVLQLAGETANPQRSVPLAIIGSVVFCIVLYTMLQIAFIGALDSSSLVGGWKQLHYVGDSGPFAGILTSLGLAWFVIIIYGDALISPFGTGYIFTASTARVNYGLSRIGFFPKSQQKLSAKGVPIAGIMLNYFIGLLLFLPFPVWQDMVSFIISCFIFSYIIGPIALICLRKIYPDHPRPFRLPWATGMGLLAFYVCNLLIFWTGWHTVYRMLIVMGIGIAFFAVHCIRGEKSMWLSQWRTSWWIIPYLAGMCLISYYGTFGNGQGNIYFGLDFFLIGIFSIIIFFLALRLCQKNNSSDVVIKNEPNFVSELELEIT